MLKRIQISGATTFSEEDTIELVPDVDVLESPKTTKKMGSRMQLSSDHTLYNNMNTKIDKDLIHPFSTQRNYIVKTGLRKTVCYTTNVFGQLDHHKV